MYCLVADATSFLVRTTSSDASQHPTSDIGTYTSEVTSRYVLTSNAAPTIGVVALFPVELPTGQLLGWTVERGGYVQTIDTLQVTDRCTPVVRSARIQNFRNYTKRNIETWHNM